MGAIKEALINGKSRHNAEPVFLYEYEFEDEPIGDMEQPNDKEDS